MFKFAIGIFLTVPAAWAQGQQISYADAIVPQMPVGCGWTATIILVNLTGHTLNFTVNFWPEGGRSDPNAQPVPRVIPIVGMGPVPSVSGTILASGSYFIRVDETARGNTTGCNGWVEINSSEALGGYVLLNQMYSIVTQQAIGGIQVHQKPIFGLKRLSRYPPDLPVNLSCRSTQRRLRQPLR